MRVIMLTFFKTWCIFLILTITISACGGEGGENDDNNFAGSSNHSESDNSLLFAVWKSSCRASELGLDTKFFSTETLSFIFTETFVVTKDTTRIKFTSAINFTSVIKNFVDNTCTKPTTSNAVDTLKGDVLIGNEITTGDGVIARKIDFQVAERNGSPDEQTLYTLFYITPKKPKELILGLMTDSLNESSPDKRSNNLDFEKVFFFQSDNEFPDDDLINSPLWQT
ncbi:hypothetical protein MNBD_GAMMA16-2018 [hydrothermal vent metagenome]|uniref:Lipoprotein n=1 Tax=hydrothermal vent metagenome TaxID=652676 RepID=A0A3B0ZPR8_9ZZZZ